MFGRILLCLSVACTVVACGDDDNDHGGGSDDSPEETGQQCGVADDCFIDLRGDDGIQGEAVCLDRVEGGYCTHTCATDADCCAVDGECETDLRQVCAPFENTDMMMCFLSCEDEDLEALPVEERDYDAATDDANAYCYHHASVDFICRSTGGGAANRKVCVPGGM